MADFDLLTGKEDVPAIPQTSGKHPDVELSERLLLEWRALAETWRNQVVEDRDFVAGAQWDANRKKEVEKRKQKPLVIDVVSPAVDQAIAMLTSNSPRFTSTGREDSDTRVARMFADLMAYVWDVNSGNVKLKQTIKDYYVASCGWLVAYYDPQKNHGMGEVCIKSIDPLNVFPDPNARDFFLQDAAHILISTLETSEQLQSYIPGINQALENAEESSDTLLPSSGREGLHYQSSSDVVQDVNRKRYQVIDRYSRIKLNMHHAYEPISGYEKLVSEEGLREFLLSRAFKQTTMTGETTYFVDPASVRDAGMMYKTYGERFHSAINMQTGQRTFLPGDESESTEGFTSIPGTTLLLEPISMHEAIADGVVQLQETLVDRIQRTYSVGGVLIYQDILPIEYYPVVPLLANFERSPFGMSPVRRVKGLQEYINGLQTLVIAHAEATANMKIGYPKGGYNEAELNRLWNKPGVTFIPYEAELGQLAPLPPPPLPNELYRNIADAKSDVERILGIYALMQGSPNDAPNTYKGTVALDEFGQRRIKSMKDDVEEFLNQLARVVIQLLQAYYTSYRVIRLLAPNGRSYALSINAPRDQKVEDVVSGNAERIDDITVGKYDVIVVSGSMLPSNRWAIAEYYKEIYKLGIIDKEEVLKKTDVADVEGVLARFGEIAQLSQQLNMAMTEIKKLRGDMQTKDRELTHALKKVEVAKFEKDLHETSTDMRKASELAKERMADEVRNFRSSKKKGKE